MNGMPGIETIEEEDSFLEEDQEDFDDDEEEYAARPVSAKPDVPVEPETTVYDGEHGGDSRPLTTGGRIPSQNSRAHLLSSRASHSPEGSEEYTDASGSDYEAEDDVTDGSNSVLITEVRGQPETGKPHLRRTKRRKPKPKPPPTARDPNDEWDTDLEIDEQAEDHDPTGRATYSKMCEKLGVVPVSYFLKHIEEPEIVMRHHGLGPQGARAIARVLRENVTLEKLNLAGNWIEAEGGMHMSRMLSENDYINELSLAENKLGPMGCYYVARMMHVNSGLRKLDLSGNDMSDKEAQHLAEAIEQNKFLKELNLSHNEFGEEGGEVLGPAIGANDILESIDLSWNRLRRKGAIAVARGIKENVRLKKCNLAWNGFGPEGGIAIADAVGANDALKELDISGNRLDGHTAFLVAKGLRKNEDLKVLKIGNNPISTAGAIQIATAIAENDSTAMDTLELSDIPVEFEFLATIESIRKRRQFSCQHGPVLRSGNTPEDIGKPAVDPYPKNPLVILREHIIVNDFRILEMLQKYDEENVLSVTPEHFQMALDDIGVPYTRSQIDEIGKKLDMKGDGRVYYGDILKEVERARAEAAEAEAALQAAQEAQTEHDGISALLENGNNNNNQDNSDNKTKSQTKSRSKSNLSVGDLGDDDQITAVQMASPLDV